MSPDPLKTLIHAYVERVWNRGELAGLEELTKPTFTYRLAGQPARDRTALHHFITLMHVAFPDWRVQIVDLIVEGNTAAIRWQGQATHQGTFQSIPATGKHITVSGINMYRLVPRDARRDKLKQREKKPIASDTA